MNKVVLFGRWNAGIIDGTLAVRISFLRQRIFFGEPNEKDVFGNFLIFLDLNL